MEEDLERILSEFKEKRALVLGDVLLDKFSWGRIERVNPEQPAAPVVRILKENYLLGGAANVANNIIALGSKCCLYGLIGNDVYGEEIKKLCEDKNIGFKEFYGENPTIIKQRIMSHGQQVARIDLGEANLKRISKENKEKIYKSLEKEIKKYDVILMSDYDKGFFDEELAQNIINFAKKENIMTFVDPKPSNISYFKGSTIVSPNKKEAEIITKIKYSNDEKTLEQITKKLCSIADSNYVVITCGKDGVTTYDREKDKNLFLKTERISIANPTGAGDTFAATFALSFASEPDIEKATRLANSAAGISVSKIGTYAVTARELKNAL